SFGKYTLLMNAFSPFLMCYIYKGQSYSAQKRINSFLNKIRTNKDTWSSIKKYYEMKREIEMNDIPGLKMLIEETFPLEIS
ncbi:MAG: hypothetical protein P8Y23_16285, partial [Candidatus Lokiarchaeota archaeon]